MTKKTNKNYPKKTHLLRPSSKVACSSADHSNDSPGSCFNACDVAEFIAPAAAAAAAAVPLLGFAVGPPAPGIDEGPHTLAPSELLWFELAPI